VRFYAVTWPWISTVRRSDGLYFELYYEADLVKLLEYKLSSLHLTVEIALTS
ncbi:hypothetical protein A2U01_0052169, partial [Trifolium medium]|nr:hypothetical protein [Trifolium medium]